MFNFCNTDLQFKIIMNQKTVQEELEKGRRERGERYDRETINSGKFNHCYNFYDYFPFADHYFCVTYCFQKIQQCPV